MSTADAVGTPDKADGSTADGRIVQNCGTAVAENARRFVAYAPAATQKQIAQYNLELRLDREARNRGAKPRPLA